MQYHETRSMRLPVRMRPSTVDIDKRIAPLVHELWRLGFATKYCCEGDDPVAMVHKVNQGRGRTPDLAYIMFGDWVEASLFASLAGPPAWDKKTHFQREREQNSRPWDWHVEAYSVRFPTRDIERATDALKRYAWRLGALLGSRTHDGEPLRSAPRIVCPTCGRVVMSRRKDARYCSRRCQLAARNRAGVTADRD